MNIINNLGDKMLNMNVLGKTESKASENKKGFAEILKETVYEANNLKKQTDGMTADLLAGKTDNLHEVMVSAQKSEIAISFVTEVRNKVLEAYQEFSRMQV